MNVRQLEAFKAIMELGSFTRAAEKLSLSQPAVSKLIYLLERTCGYALFLRQKNGVLPTPEAKMLYSEVERVFLSVESVAARAKAIGQCDHGEITLVAFPSIATRILPPIIASFIASRPGLKINFYSHNSWRLVDRVATQGIDVGFGMARTERPGVNFEKLCAMEAVCVLHPSHRLAGMPRIEAHDLAGERFIALVEEDRAQIEIDKVFAAARVDREIVLEVQLTEACCSLVAAGAGVAIVDPLSTVGFRPEELVVRPFHPTVRQEIFVVTPSFRQPSLATTGLIEHVRRHLPERIRKLTPG
jgi:DNA-binding transcriptional LysR family regulator